MQSRCCWPPERRSAGWSRLSSTSSQRPARSQRLAHRRLELALATAACEPLLAQRVGDVVEDAHRERVGLLEDHARPAGAARSPRARRRPRRRAGSRPSRVAVGVSSTSRLSERSSVVLPQPDGPISASTSPWRTGSETSLTASLLAVGDRQVLGAHALDRRGAGAGGGGALRQAGEPAAPSAAAARRCRRRAGGGVDDGRLAVERRCAGSAAASSAFHAGALPARDQVDGEVEQRRRSRSSTNAAA